MVQRKFITGEEWLYLKIYAGLGFQDKLLLNEIPDIAEGLYTDKIIDKFFFVRYTDRDGPHLRLRFHILDTSATFTIIKLIQSKFSVQGYW
jgi:thiopeptide-type bacteriocin biosynthesis protein